MKFVSFANNLRGAKVGVVEYRACLSKVGAFMSFFAILRDSWFFCRSNLRALACLCLPLLMLDVTYSVLTDDVTDNAQAVLLMMLGGVLFYPVYTAVTILFVDARRRGEHPRVIDVWLKAFSLWPTFVLMSVLSALLYMLGALLLLLPAIWIMVKLGLSQNLLVARELSPVDAMQKSLDMSAGHFWILFACLFGPMVPLIGLDLLQSALWPSPRDPLVSFFLYTSVAILQPFTTVVMYRLFTLMEEQTVEPTPTNLAQNE